MLSTSPEWPPKSLLRIPLGFVPRPAERELFLTDEQIAVAERLAQTHGAILDGPPGSGKTHLAAGIASGYAKLGRRVLFATPRKPLALWLGQALLPYGVVVQTVGECARRALRARWRDPPARQGFNDPEYFSAAAEAASADRYDLTIVDEWQTTSAAEQHFARRLAGNGRLIRIQDSSRDLRGIPPAIPDQPEILTLTEPLRSPGRVGPLDLLYWREGLDPLPSPAATSSVFIKSFEDPFVSLRLCELEVRGG